MEASGLCVYFMVGQAGGQESPGERLMVSGKPKRIRMPTGLTVRLHCACTERAGSASPSHNSFFFPAPNPGFTLIHQLSPLSPSPEPVLKPRPTAHLTSPCGSSDPEGQRLVPSLSQLNQSSSRTMTASCHLSTPSVWRVPRRSKCSLHMC